MRRLRIRSRLTLGAVVFGAIVLGVALIVARGQISSVLESTAFSLARNDLTSFALDLQKNPLEGPDAVSNGLLVVIENPQGDVVVDTAPHDVRFALPAKAQDGAKLTFRDDEGNSWIVASRVAQTSTGAWSLWAARDVSANRRALDSIDRVFLFVGIGLLALLALAFWLLARSALRPVEALRSHAEHLSDDELLPVPDADDELQRLAVTLNEMVERVRESAARERRMVSDAAHELRTPLAGLRAEIELARRHLDDAAQLDAGLASAQRASERLSELATNLLELSRVDDLGHGAVGRATAGQLASATLDAVDTGRSRASTTEVEVNVDVSISVDTDQYSIDGVSFARIADNLLGNALRAVNGRGSITVALSDDDDGLHLSVADDGPGAPEDFLPRAFERFTRADDARSSSGSGLGLALVAAIVSAAGGSVSIANANPGFVATVTIPKM